MWTSYHDWSASCIYELLRARPLLDFLWALMNRKALLLCPCPGTDWVPWELAFPPEETGVIIPKAAVCPAGALEITPCLPVRHCLLSVLLTQSHRMTLCPLQSNVPLETAYKMLYCLISLLGISHQLMQDLPDPSFLSSLSYILVLLLRTLSLKNDLLGQISEHHSYMRAK